MGSKISAPLSKIQVKKCSPKKQQLTDENYANNSNENNQNVSLDEENNYYDVIDNEIDLRSTVESTSFNSLCVDNTANTNLPSSFQSDVQSKITPAKIPLKNKLLDDHFIHDHNSNDPRSPSVHINRTPIDFHKKYSNNINTNYNENVNIVNDSPTSSVPEINSFLEFIDGEKINNDNDNNNEEITNLSTFVNAEENLESSNFDIDNISAILNSISTEDVLDDDPRSPSQQIERTPIVFEESSGFLIEIRDTKEQMKSDAAKTLISVPADDTKFIKQLIYEEETDQIKYSTPVKPMIINELTTKVNSVTANRTPLSCVANKSLIRNIYKRKENILAASVNNNSMNHLLTADENISPINTQSTRKSISKIPILRK